MIYVFFGEDSFRSQQKFREFIDSFLNDKSRSFSLYWFSPDRFSADSFEELSRTENIFGGKSLIACEGLLQEKDPCIFLKNNITSLAASENIFVFWEEALEKDISDELKKYSEKIEEFNLLSPIKIKVWLEEELKNKKISLPYDLKEDFIKNSNGNLWTLSKELEKYSLVSGKKANFFKKREEFNLFHIADAVASKNRNQAWLLFQKALLSGINPEEIFWKLVWQIKNILIVKEFISDSEKKIANKTHLHPFVVKKSVAAAKIYTEKELKRSSSELIKIYHDARKGLIDFEIGLEKFLIKI